MWVRLQGWVISIRKFRSRINDNMNRLIMPRRRSPQPRNESRLMTFSGDPGEAFQLPPQFLVTDIDEIFSSSFRRENRRQIDPERFRIVPRPEFEPIDRRRRRRLMCPCRHFVFRLFVFERFLVMSPDEHCRGEEDQIGNDCAFAESIANNHPTTVRRATSILKQISDVTRIRKEKKKRVFLPFILFLSLSVGEQNGKLDANRHTHFVCLPVYLTRE